MALNSCGPFCLCLQLWPYLFAPSIFFASLRTVLLFQARLISPASVATGSTTGAASEKRFAQDFLRHAKENKHHTSLRCGGSRRELVCVMEKCFLRVETGRVDNVAAPSYRLNNTVLFVSIIVSHPVFSHYIEPKGFRLSRVLSNSVLPVTYMTVSCDKHKIVTSAA